MPDMHKWPLDTNNDDTLANAKLNSPGFGNPDRVAAALDSPILVYLYIIRDIHLLQAAITCSMQVEDFCH